MDDNYIIAFDEKILVTGAAGFIGPKVVDTLLEYGFNNLVCFVRPTSNLDNLTKKIDQKHLNEISIIEGNLLSRGDCEKAAKDVSLVIHLAAGVEKSFAGCFLNSVVATRNLLDALIRSPGLKRFLNVSSLAVYSGENLKNGNVLDENAAVDRQPELRHEAYVYGKVKQEELLIEYNEKYKIPYVIVRPGDVYGPGKKKISGKVGIDTFGIFLHLGGKNRIPFTYIDNCADAIVLTGVSKGIENEIFNIVDDDLPASKDFLNAYKKNVKKFGSLYVPYEIFYLFSLLWEKYSIYSKGQIPPAFNRKKCIAHWKRMNFSNEKLKQRVGWEQKVETAVGLNRYFDYMRNAAN